jgi:hypothetical protein
MPHRYDDAISGWRLVLYMMMLLSASSALYDTASLSATLFEAFFLFRPSSISIPELLPLFTRHY